MSARRTYRIVRSADLQSRQGGPTESSARRTHRVARKADLPNRPQGGPIESSEDAHEPRSSGLPLTSTRRTNMDVRKPWRRRAWQS